MKKLFTGLLSVVLVFSSSVFAAYMPTDADQDIKDQVAPMIEAMVSTDVNRLVSIANKIATMLPNFDSDGRVYHVLEWVYDTIVVHVDAERARRAEMGTNTNTEMDMMEEEHMEDETMSWDDTMDDMDDMSDDSDMMSGDDTMDDMESDAMSGSDTMSWDDTMDDASTGMTHVFDLTSSPYDFSMEEIMVKVWDTVTINLTSIWWSHDWVVDEFDASTMVVSPGDDTTTVTFVADTAGTFEYYCSVGDHRAQGMIGNLIVSE